MAAVGINGADVLTTTGDPRVDLIMLLVRGAPAESLTTGLAAVLALGTVEALEDAAVMAVHARAVRGGKGERDVGAALLRALWVARPAVGAALLELWPEYGSWRDMFVLEGDDAMGVRARALAARQLRADEATPEGKSISLCAKWAPREGQPGATELAAVLFPGTRQHSSRMRLYRRLVAGLNRRLATVETLMSGGRWAEIRPAAVPGRAGKLYGRALLNLVGTTRKGTARAETLRHPDDADRMACRALFVEHFAAAAAGRATVRGADTLFPHELVRRAWADGAPTAAERDYLNAVWRSMIAATGGLGRSIMMSDFSGSMQTAGRVGDLPYWVSMALGVLGAQVAAAPFRGRLMTFDSTPRWLTFPEGADLFDCLQVVRESRAGCGMSTNFQAALELVLAELKRGRVRPGEEPENLIVLTDMGWDAARGSTGGYRHAPKHAAWETHVELLQEAFRRAGEDMWGVGSGWRVPRIVIWNLAAQYAVGQHHAAANVPGVAMLSGWSPAQFAVLQKEGPRQLTAYETLRLELDDSRYDAVRAAVRGAVGDHSDGWGARS